MVYRCLDSNLTANYEFAEIDPDKNLDLFTVYFKQFVIAGLIEASLLILRQRKKLADYLFYAGN